MRISSIPKILSNIVLIAMLMAISALIGCATKSEPAVNTPHQARIRVFHGTGAYIYFGDVCDGKSHPVIHAAAGGFSYFVPNKRIGMPQTDDMPSFSYHEYAIPAEQPVTVKMYWQMQKANGIWDSCGPIYTTFTPEINQDYDVFMKFVSGMCQGVELRKFTVATDGKISTNPAPTNSLPYESCSR